MEKRGSQGTSADSGLRLFTERQWTIWSLGWTVPEKQRRTRGPPSSACETGLQQTGEIVRHRLDLLVRKTLGYVLQHAGRVVAARAFAEVLQLYDEVIAMLHADDREDRHIGRLAAAVIAVAIHAGIHVGLGITFIE